jgi:hypothetical protein
MNRREFTGALGIAAFALGTTRAAGVRAVEPTPQFAITMDDFSWRYLAEDGIYEIAKMDKLGL